MTRAMAVNEKTLSTRQKAEKLVKEAQQNHCGALDLTSVEFITRSVADELRYFEDQGEIELRGLHGATREMYEVVSEREAPA